MMKRTKGYRMKKSLLLFVLLFLFSFSACGVSETDTGAEDLSTLREAFLKRGNSVTGYEVDEIEDFDGLKFFAVRVCLNTDDAVKVDDYVWFEANISLYATQEEADEAYRINQETGLGGKCLQEGRILMYWLNNDPFEDLYKEVFYDVFPSNKEGNP